jgi:hypothetical protein
MVDAIELVFNSIFASRIVKGLPESIAEEVHLRRSSYAAVCLEWQFAAVLPIASKLNHSNSFASLLWGHFQVALQCP